MVFLLGIALFSPGCGNKGGADEKDVAVNVQVEAAPVESGEMRQVIESSGTLNAPVNQDVKVSPLVPGRILEIRATEGDAVQKDSIIAKLDTSTLDGQLRQANATMVNAKANAERAQRLYERGIAARKEWEDAQKDLAVAQATLDTARIQISRATIRSPISGVITKRFASVGEQVDGTPTQPIAEVANFDPIELVATLQASFLPNVKEGQKAEVKTDAYAGTVFEGEIISVLPSVDAATNMGTLRIRIPNVDHRLRGGMFATASIVAAIHENAVYVPASALSTANNQPTIFVVRSDSTVQARRVQVGWRDGNKVEILANAKRGEIVVTTGSYGLSDNMHVTVKNNVAGRNPS